MISVVLPVYNGEKYLRYSIESVLNQTYKDIELVIVNDCSTDNTVSIIEEYMKVDSRVKLINNTSNQKLPKSLNIGFSNCSGDYFTWTSDDNIMLANALEVLLDNLKEKDVDLVFSRCETIDEDGKVLGKTELYKDLNEIYYNNIVLASFLYKREVHEKLCGYDVNKFLVEDYDFWLRAYSMFKFAFVPDVLYEIRFHNDKLGVKRLEDVKLGKIQLLKNNLMNVNDVELKDFINKEISQCYFELSNAFYSRLENKKCKRALSKTRNHDLVKRLLGMY